MILTKRRLGYSWDMVCFWARTRSGCSIPFICAYVLWRSGEKVSTKKAKSIAKRVFNFLWNEKKAGRAYCEETEMSVFDTTRAPDDKKINPLTDYPWTGVSKDSLKWGRLTKDDMLLFHSCKEFYLKKAKKAF